MATIESFLIPRKNPDKNITADLHLPAEGTARFPVVIILHGLKGFKDWGHFPKIAEQLARSGFAALRFNFSHNGTTAASMTEFVDEDAFGKNTYSLELEDTLAVIDFLWMNNFSFGEKINPGKIGLLGHSRGGGIAMLAAKKDSRVRAVATWAGVSDFEPRVNRADLEEWKKKGVRYIANARTGQQLPEYYSLREDFYANKKNLDIPSAVKSMTIPQLIVHGTKDEVVPFSEGEQMHIWNMFSQFVPVEGANHTFGGRHPWTENKLHEHTVKALEATIKFFRENL